MKRLSIVLAAVIVILLGVFIFAPSVKGPTLSQTASSTAPALSAGGTVSDTGTVQGKVVLGPICPVERIPPHPACAPKPYQTSVAILRNSNNGSAPVKVIQSDSSGMFTVSLASGVYIFHPRGGSVYPRCHDQNVAVTAGQTSNITINCDTGIR